MHLNIVATLFCVLLICISSDCLSILKDINLRANETLENENTVSRDKRFLDPVTIGIIGGLIASAAVSAGTVALTEFYRASSNNECAVTIRYRSKLRYSALNMNFKSQSEDNWNYEKITDYDSIDYTKEKVTGGFLSLIQIYPEGKFCLEAIIFSCGSQLNKKSSERSLIIDVPTIRKAWFRQGNTRFLEVDWNKNCLWFSGDDFTSVRAIDVYPCAFTACENADENCISTHIEVF